MGIGHKSVNRRNGNFGFPLSYCYRYHRPIDRYGRPLNIYDFSFHKYFVENIVAAVHDMDKKNSRPKI